MYQPSDVKACVITQSRSAKDVERMEQPSPAVPGFKSGSLQQFRYNIISGTDLYFFIIA